MHFLSAFPMTLTT